MKRIFAILGMVIFVSSGCSSFQLFNTIANTSTPLPTNTPYVETLTPTPTITATPNPIMSFEEADKELFNGNFNKAYELYQDAYNNSSDETTMSASLYGMARSKYLSGDYKAAVNTFNNIIDRFPKQTTVSANTNYFLAMSYKELGSTEEAAKALSQYLVLKPPVLTDYIQELRGDLLIDTGDRAAAIIAYETAIKYAKSSDLDRLNTKIGRAYQAMGDHHNAIRIFLEIYEETDNDYVKAQMNQLAGESYMLINLPEQAYARFQDSVLNYPLSYNSYLGLVTLIDDNIPVDGLSRGIVDYYAGQYGVAVDALTQYNEENPEHDGTSLHYIALCYRAIGENDKAIEEWENLIDDYAGDQYWIDAWEELIYTQWAYLENYDLAANTAISFVKRFPTNDYAADFLYLAARNYERGGNLEKAATTWGRLIDEYPSAELSYRAMFLSGITYYRINEFVKAQNAFQRVLVLGVEPSEIASAYLWIGKTQYKQNLFDEATKSWQLAEQKDPNGYYSLRAKELLLDISPFSDQIEYNLDYDLEYERKLAELWMRTTFNIADDVDLSSFSIIQNDKNFLRGNEYWELNQFSEATTEFEELRTKLSNDPAGSFQFLNYLMSINHYRSAIFTSRQILDLANMDDNETFTAPLYFNHIRFGIYYPELIVQESLSEGLDPLFVYGLIRTESLFEAFVESSAGAHGLMQIIPSTAKDVTEQLNWPAGFTTDDLARPYVNVTLGTYYLSKQRDYFNDNLYAALAAYNGGPGNAAIWLNLANNDPDLFLEIIRFDETQNHIRSTVENYYLYRQFYETGL